MFLPLLQPHCTKVSTQAHPYADFLSNLTSTFILIFFLVNSGIAPLSMFHSLFDLTQGYLEIFITKVDNFLRYLLYPFIGAAMFHGVFSLCCSVLILAPLLLKKNGNKAREF